MPDRRARIFLLSHMRAYTSLAGHVLGSHPQINGYYEMHLGYEEPAALDRQLQAFLQDEVLKPGSRYLFDKLLHNDYVLKPERAGSVGDQDPGRAGGAGAHDQEHRASVSAEAQSGPVCLASRGGEVLRRAGAGARRFCRTTEWPYAYFDAELLLCAPENLLARLTDWLELESPLSERYEGVQPDLEGAPGDTSERVRSGQIDRMRSDYSHVVIPQEVLGAAQEAYRECREAIVAGAADSLVL